MSGATSTTTLDIIATTQEFNSNLETLKPFEIIDVQSGNGFSIFLTRDGDVYGIGESAYGQVGVVNASSKNFNKLSISKVRAIAACYWGTMMHTVNDDIYVCGYNGDQRFGFRGSSGNLTMEKCDKMSQRGVRLFAGGAAHVVYVLKDDTVWVGGNTTSGYNFDISNISEYQWFTENHHVVSKVACGNSHTAFITTTGRLIISAASSSTTHQDNYFTATRGKQYVGEAPLSEDERCIDLAVGSGYTLVLTDQNNIYLYQNDVHQIMFKAGKYLLEKRVSLKKLDKKNSNLPTIAKLLGCSASYGFLTSDGRAIMDSRYDNTAVFKAKGDFYEFDYAAAAAQNKRTGTFSESVLHASIAMNYAVFVIGTKHGTLFHKEGAPHQKKSMSSALSNFLIVLQDITIVTQH